MRIYLGLLVLIIFGSSGFAQRIAYVNANIPEAMQVNLPASIEVCEGETVQLGESPVVTGGAGNLIYLWSPTVFLDDPTSEAPVFSGDETTSYMLIVTDQNNCTTEHEVTVEVSVCTDIDERVLNTEVYPNPFSNELIVHCSHKAFTLDIYNASGVCVFSEVVEDQEKIFSLKQLPKGIYTVLIQSDRIVSTHRIIKN
ncbi:MAG: hypothetical protein C0594_08730 [Marinilabiliales bacterium]|nr:MAG: hypothetical protein C0594_08730 [Marinilabiliales bacterium]